MPNSETNKLFLKKVHLRGYKSIKDVEIDFQPGLNIIIGKNAAGKTNFLKFLNNTLNFDFESFNNFKSEIVLINTKRITIEVDRNISLDGFFDYSDLSNVNTKLTINDEIFETKKVEVYASNEELRKNSVFYNCNLLMHGIPDNYPIVKSSFSFRIENKVFIDDLSNIVRDFELPYFVRCIAIDLMSKANNLNKNNVEEIKISLIDFLNQEMPINEYLNRYSPIEEVRFSQNFNVFFDTEKEILYLENLFLEFKIEGAWHPFSNLSDGTQRLFFIISEVLDNRFNGSPRPVSYGLYLDTDKIGRIILIEEPELGIHPHQFQKLLEFLKIQSEKSQIIISTHSPQSLDTLKSDEFNRIIIAYTKNTKEGTKLRHLTDVELKKANEYIKEDFLSDYWLYSDLEK